MMRHALNISATWRCCARNAYLLVALVLAFAENAGAHGTLVNDRMFQVRVAGPNGQTPAAWNESFYTWSQNSHNFPDYAAPGFSYAQAVPDGTIAHAGINDGVQTALNFTALGTPSLNWQATAATAGQPCALRWVATAPHDPSFFEVYLTKSGFNAATQTLTWGALEKLGRWALHDPAFPVTNGTAPSPAGGTSLSYDWSIRIPADRTGRHVVVVIWQRQDPAGEAFFAVQDLDVSPAITPPQSQLSISLPANGIVHLQLRAEPNRAWTIQKTAALDSGVWTTLATGNTNDTGVLEVTDPKVETGSAFYRAVPSSTPP